MINNNYNLPSINNSQDNRWVWKTNNQDMITRCYFKKAILYLKDVLFVLELFNQRCLLNAMMISTNHWCCSMLSDQASYTRQVRHSLSILCYRFNKTPQLINIRSQFDQIYLSAISLHICHDKCHDAARTSIYWNKQKKRKF